MAFGDLRRPALDIEVTTAPGFEFPNAARESDRIIGRRATRPIQADETILEEMLE